MFCFEASDAPSLQMCKLKLFFFFFCFNDFVVTALASRTQLNARPSCDQKVAGTIPTGSGNIDHKIFSTVFFSLPLFQEGRLSILAKECTKIQDNHLDGYACPGKVQLGKLTRST